MPINKSKQKYRRKIKKTRKRVMRGGLVWGKSEDEKYSSVVKAIEDKNYDNIIETVLDELGKDLDYNDYNDYEILLLYLLLFDEKLIQPQILDYYKKNHGDYIKKLNEKYKNKNQYKRTRLVYRDIILEHIIIFCKFPSYHYIKNIHYADKFTTVCDKIIETISHEPIWDNRFKSLMKAFVYCKLGYFYASTKYQLQSVNNFELARSEYDKFLSPLLKKTKEFEDKMYYYSIEEKQTDRLNEEIKYAQENSTKLYNEPEDPYIGSSEANDDPQDEGYTHRIYDEPVYALASPGEGMSIKLSNTSNTSNTPPAAYEGGRRRRRTRKNRRSKKVRQNRR
jgi:hypothetical protein